MKKLKKLPFNIIDVIIVIAVIALGVGIFMRSEIRSNNEKTDPDVAVITIKAKGFLAEYAPLLLKNDTAYFKSDLSKLGLVIEKEIRPSVEYDTVDGTLVSAQYDTTDRVDVVLTVRATGSLTAGGFLVGGVKYIAPGAAQTVLCGGIEFDVTVLSVEY